MRYINLFYLSLLLVPIIAHGADEEMDNGMDKDMNHGDKEESSNASDENRPLEAVPHVNHHQHGRPILETELLPEERLFWENYNSTNYFNHPSGNNKSMYLFISLILISFIFVYPILLVLNNLKFTYTYILGLMIHTAIVLIALSNYSVFISSLPDLYPNNVFNKFNWIYLFSTIFHLFITIIKFGYDYSQDNYEPINDTNNDAMDSDGINSPSITLYDLTRNNSPHSFELNDPNTPNLDDLENFSNDLNVHINPKIKSMAFKNFFINLINMKGIKSVISSFGKFSIVLFNLTNWFNFLFFLVYFPTGVATFGLLGMGNTVFNLLAHFIKGGVFFSLGLLSLSRYCGAYRNKGWAWNYKLIHTTDNTNRWIRLQPKGLLTMEFVESFLIFFYGSTNIFMEHLANPGGEWSPKDLEHVSIAFIYIGCGLCGLLTEIKLNSWRYHYSNEDYKTVVKSSPGFSPNPFPIFTIFWTGYLMSKHQQASHLSTEIHSQWGNLLMYGTFFRFGTYLLALLLPKPQNLEVPSKPITELISSFALLCGGLIFMESCDPIILALEYRGYNAMFTLNLSLGVITLLMGWQMLVFQIKALLKRKYC